MPDRDIFTVRRLNREARMLLERGLGTVWLTGEVSNLSRPGSGHWYFCLKDEDAQVRCAMFRSRNMLVRGMIRDGSQVLVRGRVSLYEARGEFQLVVEHLEDAGAGLLRLRFEELRQKLAAEGLFDPRHRKPLPVLPRRIGVITSPTGAAIRDILHVLGRRFAAVPVLIYPVAVQGAAAAHELEVALALAAARAECDVLILARGGGSIEDLQAFNEESVARAIFACPIPVVCGIGHEVDFTIADFVADERAPTPSGAAERAVPDAAAWLRTFESGVQRVAGGLRRRLQGLATVIEFRRRALERAHPGARLRQHAQRLDELDGRMRFAMRATLVRAAGRIDAANALLARASPVRRVEAFGARHAAAQRALVAAGRHRLAQARGRLEFAARMLHATSPLATLARGYAIVTDQRGRVLRDSADTAVGAGVDVRLARGSITASVVSTAPAAPDADVAP